MSDQLIAVVRVRGVVNIPGQVRDTLRMLHLDNKNYCTFIKSTPYYLGMLKKVKDFVTYGAVDEATFKDVLSKRGDAYTGPEKDSKGKISYARRYFDVDGKKFKKYVRLNPPRGGYGRKGIKLPFSRSGALGDRKEKINDLLKRMM